MSRSLRPAAYTAQLGTLTRKVNAVVTPTTTRATRAVMTSPGSTLKIRSTNGTMATVPATATTPVTREEPPARRKDVRLPLVVAPSRRACRLLHCGGPHSSVEDAEQHANGHHHDEQAVVRLTQGPQRDRDDDESGHHADRDAEVAGGEVPRQLAVAHVGVQRRGRLVASSSLRPSSRREHRSPGSAGSAGSRMGNVVIPVGPRRVSQRGDVGLSGARRWTMHTGARNWSPQPSATGNRAPADHTRPTADATSAA